jgi:two-component system, cell cycle sensor histidine kinase and response regulator CckA
VEWSEELSGALLRAVPDAVLVLDGGRVALVNDGAEALFGRPRADLLGRDARTVLRGDASALTPGTRELTVRRGDGAELPAEASLAAVDSPRGPVVVAVLRDVGERRRADAEHARLRAEAQGQRDQRLESLGQLAGGVAHDFNNLLGVIVNYAGFVIEEAESPAPDVATIAADARQVIRAGERGTELTHQLLAFARREVVRPQTLDLNALVAGLEPQLRQSVGERVTLVTRPAAGVPPVTCDPGQLEQLLVSLARNARDAMPDGGDLVIDTGAFDEPGAADLAPGRYVRLRVCDGGRGMAREVLERAFEPFFTTKASGEGTGLGLATVYGVVSQAGGAVRIASEPGVGTAVTVLLPAAARDEPDPAPAAGPAVTTGHGETLLVVEDEDALRDVAGRILAGAGYRVLAADGGPRALELAARHEGGIDLLISDVVMPGMLGKDLAERLVGVRPDTRVLYMSGYAQPVLASHGTLDPGVALLEKPFTAADLLEAVRRRLDG